MNSKRIIVIGVAAFVAVAGGTLLGLGFKQSSTPMIGSGVTLLIVSGIVFLDVFVTKKFVSKMFGVDESESFTAYATNADGTIDLGDYEGGLDETTAMRAGLDVKAMPLDIQGLSGDVGDYPHSGDGADAIMDAAHMSGVPALGADIPDDELAAWSGLHNPGASETMIIAHGDQLGIDTTGQTMRNRSLDLRGEPIIPPAYTSPFGQSSITRSAYDEAAYMRLG